MGGASFSRRNVLSAGLALGSATAASPLVQARSITGQLPWEPGAAAAPPAATSTAPPAVFFTSEERTFVDAAVSHLIPKDELGPGALEAGVTDFLDRQLAGSYGHAATWYMQGPWHDGTPSQGNQSRLTPAQTYRNAIKAIDDHCRKTFGNKAFSQLAADDQDKLLTQLENGKIDLKGVDAKAFFEAFLQNTIEGFLSDPIYGGNRDMAGWRLLGFPGARYDYRGYVSKHGEKLGLSPVGLKI
jgi:gluconate 2-dehydrogenase gamma chain